MSSYTPSGETLVAFVIDAWRYIQACQILEADRIKRSAWKNEPYQTALDLWVEGIQNLVSSTAFAMPYGWPEPVKEILHSLRGIRPVHSYRKAEMGPHLKRFKSLIERLETALSGPCSYSIEAEKRSKIGKAAQEKIVAFFKENPKPEWKALEDIMKAIGSKSEPVTRRRLKELVDQKALESQPGKSLWRLTLVSN
jgi:hypothetical protein